MARRFVRALALLAAATLGCQTYNFNPVSHCLIQPGTKRSTLSSVSTADILFVIDDSNSMQPIQENLGQSFSTFINNLNAYNTNRAAKGLAPIDFHIAVTTTSVYENSILGSPYTCQSNCPGASGTVCCNTSAAAPEKVPRVCTSGEACAGGYSCSSSCSGYEGVAVCCGSGGVELDTVPCTTVGDSCGNYRISYIAGACSSWGVGQSGAVYPHGNFVAQGTNPRVLHFDKQLYPSYKPCTSTTAVTDCGPTPAFCQITDPLTLSGFCRKSCSGPTDCPTGYACEALVCEPTNLQGYTQTQLMGFFAKNTGTQTAPNWVGNAIVGVCGSGEEQGIQAAKLALQKAWAKQQKDVSATGAQVTADWPHSSSKLVVVFVGDEDDCSSPEDPIRGITLSGTPGVDSCVADANLKPPTKLFDVNTYLGSYLGTLRSPDLLAGGFIEAVPSSENTCVDLKPEQLPDGTWTTPCTASADGGTTCGSAVGFRFLTLGNDIAAGGSSVVAGPVCSSDFGPILDRLANIVKPPVVLTLTTPPATDDMTILRIANVNGVTRLICKGPAPAGTSLTDAKLNYDWWFTATADGSGNPQPPTQYVYINHDRGTCEANPGETYSADYIGILPSPSATNPTGGCASVSDCTAALGGTAAEWQCCASVDQTGACQAPVSPSRGTCLCTGAAL